MTEQSTTAPPASPQEALARFRARREEVVASPTGSLALVMSQWVDSEQTIWSVPGVWAPAGEGASGLRLTATAADDIRVDGELVDGVVVVRGADDAAPSEVVFREGVVGRVMANGEGGYGLRVWDANAEAVQRFGGIDAFDYNPEWVVTGTFVENPEGTTLGFEHLKDEGSTREKVIPGTIAVSKDGVDYELAAFKAGKALQLVFSDATSGDSTYSVGRFLFVAPNPDGSITLDFNRALLPPCAFSYYFNCPLPPKQNRFSVPIEAGEKNVLANDGSLLH